MVESGEIDPKILEIIPEKVFKAFFDVKTTTMPNLAKDYDVIGFDVDLCLGKYNVMRLVEHTINAQTAFMIEKLGYPAELKSNLPQNYLDYACNSLVWDISNDLILKLGSGKKILKAMRAFENISEEEIARVYGAERLFTQINLPKRNGREDGKKFWGFGSFFESNFPVVVMAEQSLRKKKLFYVSSEQFLDDIYKYFDDEYTPYDGEKLLDTSTFGSYYPKIFQDPGFFIEPQPELRETLIKLRAKGVKLFVGTNAIAQYGEMVLKATFGEDWQQLFDLTCSWCGKPGFFMENNGEYFKKVNI